MQSTTLHSRAIPTRRLVRRAVAASAAAVLTAVALSGPAVAASSAPANGGTPPYVPTQGSPIDAGAQGIIMSDGNICNPRWGC